METKRVEVFTINRLSSRYEPTTRNKDVNTICLSMFLFPITDQPWGRVLLLIRSYDNRGVVVKTHVLLCLVSTFDDK